MNIFVLLYNSGTDKEGIHSIELKGRAIVLMFEDKDDATRYCGLLEAQDFPLPTVEMIDIEEIREFCTKLDYECKLVEKNSILMFPTSVSKNAVVMFYFLNNYSGILIAKATFQGFP